MIGREHSEWHCSGGRFYSRGISHFFTVSEIGRVRSVIKAFVIMAESLVKEGDTRFPIFFVCVFPITVEMLFR